MADRLAVTGLGVVTPAGIGIEAFWSALLDGASAVRTIGGFDAGKFPCQIAGELEGFSARTFVPKGYRKAVKVMARDIEIAVAAADLAVRDSGLVTRGTDGENTSIDSKRLGCNIGAGLICTDLNELGMAVNTAVVDGKFDLKQWGRQGMGNLTPLWLLKYLPNMLACHVTIIHGAEGPSNTITCGDASAHLAVGEAARTVARGSADAAIAGGAESKLNPMGLLRQGLLGRLCVTRNGNPSEACRPFDTAHDGTVIGEGGGLVIIENLRKAQARSARIYAEIVGFGAACDPEGMNVSKPTAGGMGLAAQRAMADAGIVPEQIDLIVAHGTAVPGEDSCECQAWRQAIGSQAGQIPAVAITGAIGSLFAGAGGIELATAVMALQTQTVPPTVNFDSGWDGECLRFASQPQSAALNYVITGAFGIGGQSAACVLKRYEA